MEGLKIWGEGNQSNLAIIGMLLMINVIASNAVGVEPRLAACISNGPENPSEGKLVGRLYFLLSLAEILVIHHQKWLLSSEM